MANILQHKRGATAQRLAYTPADGEFILDLTTKQLFVGNGSTAGGVPVEANDSSKLPLEGGTLTGQLTVPAIANSWIAGTAGNSPVKLTPSNASSWCPWISQRTSGGNGWAVGQLGENWYLSWAAKANIDAGTNTTTQVITASSNGNVTIPGTVTAPSFAGNASSATKLATARTIGGVSFDGTANINLPGVNAAGNQSTTGNAATATKLATPVNINGVAFDGTVNINTPVFSTGIAGLVPARVGAVATKYLREDGTWVTPTNTTYSAMTQAEVDAGTETTARIISPSLLKSAVLKHAPVPGADNALFLGSVMWFNGQRAAVPDGYVTADGQVLNRSDYPSLWSAINGGRFVLVNDATWTLDPLVRASYSSGNGTSTFRLPDLNGAQENSLKGSFLRGDGLGNVDLAGKMQGDAIRNITGETNGLYLTQAIGAAGTGALRQRASDEIGHGSATNNVNMAEVFLDASLQVPTANENRPVSSVGVWIIRVSGATSPLPAAGSPATLLANVFNGSQKIVGGLEVTGDINLGGQSLTDILNTLPMLGVGQTWQSMIGQRASGTIYQNTTGKPIAVVIGGASSEQQAQCSADSVTWVNVGNVGKSGSFIASTTFIVPNQHYYRITADVNVWSELR